MTATMDLFTPIHKAVRSMIYDLGHRLQRTDFTDAKATEAVLIDLEHEFSNVVPASCILCLVHHHGEGEESSVFPALKGYDAKLVEELIAEHHEVLRKMQAISKASDELRSLAAPAARLEAGRRVNRLTNAFFGYYLAHMNREEEEVVPMMRERFTDEQMAAIQSGVMQALSPEQLGGYLRWMVPSLDVDELCTFYGALKAAPPPLKAMLAQVAEKGLEAERWSAVRARTGF